MAEQAENLYAQSLYSIAREENTEEAFLQSLQQMRQVFSENPRLYAVLCSPMVLQHERNGLIDRVFAGTQPQLVNFLKVLCDRRRLGLFDAITALYEQLYFEERNIQRFTAVSAFAIEPDQLTRLKKKLEEITGAQVLIECRTDPSVMGGILLQSGGRRYDATVKTQLEGLRARLHEMVL